MKYLKILALSLLIIAVGYNIWQNYNKGPTEFSKEYYQQLAEGTGATLVRAFTGLEGDTTGTLDKIDGDDLNDGDVAIVVTDTGAYFYTLDATYGDVADVSPGTIKPTRTYGTKMWVLTTLFANGVDTTPQDDAAIDYEPNTSGETRYYSGPNHDSDGTDDDNFEIRRSATPGTNVDYRVLRRGVGIDAMKTDKVTQDYQEVQMAIFDWTEDITTGDGAFYFTIDQKLHTMNISYLHAQVITAGTTGTLDIMLYNMGGSHDILSAPIQIDSTELTSTTGSSGTINVAGVTGEDVIRIDIDSVPTTAPKGLIVTIGFSI